LILLVHLLLLTLATLFGWDCVRRLSPVAVPGVIARVAIAVIATVLWVFAPLTILMGMATVGVLMFAGRWVAVESYHPWGRDVLDYVLKRKQLRGQHKADRVVESKLSAMGKRFEVKDKIGKRIPKL
jgi:uncharacterized membrane protein YgcG